MHMNVEIEFKTRISKDKYEELISAFSLEENVFKQTNFYFDTNELDLNKKSMVLRIRQKKETFKLTLKSQSETGAFEYHVLITPEQAKSMKKNGFHTRDFFEQIDYHVFFQTSLDNFRASTPYMGGVLFLDYNEYCGRKDYELEFEADHFELGLETFNKMLEKFQITFEQTKRKSERALACIIDL
ncbi:CYTH domain-containing protein [Acholeplasma granularum]|uniref:CYTH domain-containing protein n=1 Tax=Acholeplasma granularum TaxID=264635 RepID=UPI00046F5E52|nr:CYTH domain-containing protein [Acholeplasma granularum]